MAGQTKVCHQTDIMKISQKRRLPDKIPYTKEGYQKIQSDIAMYTEKRKGAVIALRTAREMGDLSENGAYKAARFELSDIDRYDHRTVIVFLNKSIHASEQF